MPKMNVAFSLDEKELKRFDEWRASRVPPLARGPALIVLLDHWEDSLRPPERVVEADDAPY